METDETSRKPSETHCHSGTGASAPITVGQRIDRICDAANVVLKGSHDVVAEFKGLLDIDGRVGRNPYAMVAAAAGSGYVLGGGLFSPLTGRVLNLGLRLGLRLAAIPYIQHELLGFVDATFSDGNRSGSASGKSQHAKVTHERSCYDEPEKSETHRQG